MRELTSEDIAQVHGGQQSNRDQLLRQIGDLGQQLRRGGSGGLAMPPLGDFSTIRSHGYYQPPGMGYRVEYPGGFKPNGDAVSWRTRNNQSGEIIASGTNP